MQNTLSLVGGIRCKTFLNFIFGEMLLFFPCVLPSLPLSLFRNFLSLSLSYLFIFARRPTGSNTQLPSLTPPDPPTPFHTCCSFVAPLPPPPQSGIAALFCLSPSHDLISLYCLISQIDPLSVYFLRSAREFFFFLIKGRALGSYSAESVCSSCNMLKDNSKA